MEYEIKYFATFNESYSENEIRKIQNFENKIDDIDLKISKLLEQKRKYREELKKMRSNFNN